MIERSERAKGELRVVDGFGKASVSERGVRVILNRSVIIVCYAFVPMKRVKRHGSILRIEYMWTYRLQQINDMFLWLPQPTRA